MEATTLGSGLQSNRGLDGVSSANMIDMAGVGTQLANSPIILSPQNSDFLQRLRNPTLLEIVISGAVGIGVYNFNTNNTPTKRILLSTSAAIATLVVSRFLTLNVNSVPLTSKPFDPTVGSGRQVRNPSRAFADAEGALTNNNTMFTGVIATGERIPTIDPNFSAV